MQGGPERYPGGQTWEKVLRSQTLPGAEEEMEQQELTSGEEYKVVCTRGNQWVFLVKPKTHPVTQQFHSPSYD